MILSANQYQKTFCTNVEQTTVLLNILDILQIFSKKCIKCY